MNHKIHKWLAKKMQKDHTPPQMMHDAVYHITLSNNDELEVI
jgi:hypothetical protein